MSVRGLIAGGMSAAPDDAGAGDAVTVVPTAVTVEDELADGEDIVVHGEMAVPVLG